MGHPSDNGPLAPIRVYGPPDPKPYPPVTHEQILDLQLLFYDELFRFAVESPAKWMK